MTGIDENGARLASFGALRRRSWGDRKRRERSGEQEVDGATHWLIGVDEVGETYLAPRELAPQGKPTVSI